MAGKSSPGNYQCVTALKLQADAKCENMKVLTATPANYRAVTSPGITKNKRAKCQNREV